MFHGRSANEVGIASAAVVLALVQRLVKKGTLKREDALALLGDAADRLEGDPRDTTAATTGAADLIRRESAIRAEGLRRARPSRHREMLHARCQVLNC